MSADGIERFEITLRDVYDHVTQIGAQISTLTGHWQRVDDRLETAQQQRNDHEARLRVIEQFPKVPVADYETRLRALERFRFTLMGAAAAVGALSATITILIEYAVTHH